MRKHFKIAISIFLLFTLGSLAAIQSKTEIALQKERTRLEQADDPVSRTKINIKISDLLLGQVIDAAREGNDGRVEMLLNDYTNTIRDAHLTMMKTGKDAHKHPSGYKDLEISLRKQQRQLSDTGKFLEYDKREPVDKARKLASDISDQLVKVMLLKEPNAARKP